MFNQNMSYPNFYPYQNIGMGIPKRGIGAFFKGHSINWGNLLNNTQKTLNVINQAIPVYYQVKPIYNNAKTMLRMVSALKDDNNDNKGSTNNNSSNYSNNKKNTDQEGPVFFL